MLEGLDARRQLDHYSEQQTLVILIHECTFICTCSFIEEDISVSNRMLMTREHSFSLSLSLLLSPAPSFHP